MFSSSSDSDSEYSEGQRVLHVVCSGRSSRSIAIGQDAEGQHLDEDEEEDDRHQTQCSATATGNNGISSNNPQVSHGNNNNNNGALLSGMGIGRPRTRDQTDAERRAKAHAYADELEDRSREEPGYDAPGRGSYGGGGGSATLAERQRPSYAGPLPSPPSQGGVVPGINGLSAVDARVAAALAARTRLAAGGVAVGIGMVGTAQRPEAGPVLAAGQAAAAAAAALRRGPTPGSHSLPSMVLVPLEALKAHRRVPRSSDRRFVVLFSCGMGRISSLLSSPGVGCYFSSRCVERQRVVEKQSPDEERERIRCPVLHRL